jgi:hypothetical protein
MPCRPAGGLAAAYAAFDHVDVAAVAVDDLATVAAGCAKANPGCLQDGNLEAVFQQEECGGQAGVAGTDDADVGFDIALQAGRDGTGLAEAA